MAKNVRKAIAIGVAGLVAALMSVFGIRVYCGLRNSQEAEITLHGYHTTLVVLIAYLRQHPGSWPRGWEELAETEIPPDLRKHVHGWPTRVPEIRKRVRINFDLTLSDVAAMDIESFSAVQQIGPNYGPDEGRIKSLLELAREQTGSEGKRESER